MSIPIVRWSGLRLTVTNVEHTRSGTEHRKEPNVSDAARTGPRGAFAGAVVVATVIALSRGTAADPSSGP